MQPEPFEVSMTGSTLRGRNRPLFEITEDDATETQDAAALKALAFKNLKAAIYNLQFQLWSIRRRNVDRYAVHFEQPQESCLHHHHH